MGILKSDGWCSPYDLLVLVECLSNRELSKLIKKERVCQFLCALRANVCVNMLLSKVELARFECSLSLLNKIK